MCLYFSGGNVCNDDTFHTRFIKPTAHRHPRPEISRVPGFLQAGTGMGMAHGHIVHAAGCQLFRCHGVIRAFPAHRSMDAKDIRNALFLFRRGKGPQ